MVPVGFYPNLTGTRHRGHLCVAGPVHLRVARADPVQIVSHICSIICDVSASIFDDSSVGDQIAWYANSIGRGCPSDAPGARRCTGTVSSVVRHSDGHVVALLVERVGRIGGPYVTTVRLDYGHEPTRI